MDSSDSSTEPVPDTTIPGADAKVTPATTPEAERSAAKWKKAKLPQLAPDASADDALAEIVRGCVEHLRGNAACVLTRAHEEGVHQMRVAVRRLRSAMALFEPYIPARQHAYLKGELKWLIGELGAARDWDVFVTDILSPVRTQFADEDRIELLARRVDQTRDEAYGRAQTAVASQRYTGLLLFLDAWGDGRRWRIAEAGDEPAPPAGSAADVSHRLLDDIRRQMLEAAQGFESLDAEARHAVRIQIKKLRYATEFFSSLYPKRKVTPYVAAMKSLQDQLGVSNDVTVAGKLLKKVVKSAKGKERAKLAYAAGLVVGWHSHVRDGREAVLVQSWQRFERRPPFWDSRAVSGDGGAPLGSVAVYDVPAAPEAVVPAVELPARRASAPRRRPQAERART